MIHWRDIPVRDWRLIHTHLLWLISAMLVAGLALLFSQGYLQYTTRQLRPLQTKLREIRATADTAQAEYQAAERGRTRYLELETRGLIGKEHRLEWVERLTTSRNTLITPELRYRIEAQKPLELSEPSGNSMLYASLMNLQYVVRHEEGFSQAHRMLDNVPGRAVPLRCQISRKQEQEAPATDIGLIVDCDYLWLTVAPASAPTSAGQEAPQ